MKRLSFVVICLVISFSVFAKNINLYDQPKNDAKVLTQIDPETGIVPIFTPKDNPDWIKVGDPKNGNVGWIKSNELTASGESFSYIQSVVNQNGKPKAYQVLKVGSPKTLDTKQSEALIKKIETEQRLMQQKVQRMMQEMYQSSGLIQPIIMPIIWYPDVHPATQKK